MMSIFSDSLLKFRSRRKYFACDFFSVTIVLSTLLVSLFTISCSDDSAQNTQIANENRQKAESFLADNKTKTGIQTTASGLQYQILTRGTIGGNSPTRANYVRVNYKGTLLNGTEFDNSYKRGVPAEFGVTQVISGWTEGLQLMKIGDKFRFFIHPDLGYGNQVAGSIPPGSLLIFEVELLAIF